MIKVKSLEDASRNYCIGVVQGTYKYKESWKNKGFSEEDSIKKAVKYAIGQLGTGVSSRTAKKRISELRELAIISNVLADMLEKSHSN